MPPARYTIHQNPSQLGGGETIDHTCPSDTCPRAGRPLAVRVTNYRDINAKRAPDKRVHQPAEIAAYDPNRVDDYKAGGGSRQYRKMMIDGTPPTCFGCGLPLKPLPDPQVQER